MDLRYIDVCKLGDYFRRLDLNEDNIIEFICNNDYDKNEDYILKCYLIGLFEDYNHINELSKYSFKSNLSPSMQVIKKDKKKVFWKEVSKFKNTVYAYSSYNDLIDLIYDGIILYKDIISGNSSHINDFNDIVSNINKDNGTLFKNKGLTFNYIYDFIDKNNISGTDCIYDAILYLLNRDVYSSKLRLDLMFNYNMICFIFSNNIISISNINDLLFEIRKKNDSEDYFVNLVNNNYEKVISLNYKSLKLESSLLNKSFYSNDYSNKMDDILKEFSVLYSIVDDNIYFESCLRLCRKLFSISPFYNSNSRTSRLLFYSLLLRHSLLPPKIDGSFEIDFDCFNNVNLDNYFSF